MFLKERTGWPRRERCPLIEMCELQEIQEAGSVLGPGRSIMEWHSGQTSEDGPGLAQGRYGRIFARRGNDEGERGYGEEQGCRGVSVRTGLEQLAERILKAVLRFGLNRLGPGAAESQGYALSCVDLAQDGFQCRNPWKGTCEEPFRRSWQRDRALLSLVIPQSFKTSHATLMGCFLYLS